MKLPFTNSNFPVTITAISSTMQTSKLSTMMNRKTQFRALSELPFKLFSSTRSSSATTTGAPRNAPVNPIPKLKRNIDGGFCRLPYFYSPRFLQASFGSGNLNSHVSRNPTFQDLRFRMPIEPQYELACKSVDDGFRKNGDLGEMNLLRLRGANGRGGDKSETFLNTMRYKPAGYNKCVTKMGLNEVRRMYRRIVESDEETSDDSGAPPPPRAARAARIRVRVRARARVSVRRRLSPILEEDSDDSENEPDPAPVNENEPENEPDPAPAPVNENEPESKPDPAPANENEPAAPPANENEDSETDDDSTNSNKKKKMSHDSDSDSGGFWDDI